MAKTRGWKLPAVHMLLFSSYSSEQSGDPSHRYLMGTHSPEGHSNGCHVGQGAKGNHNIY
uniref:Uncharacterized protein n=1 Tax=Heterorhabditis bacteriophora TaxID=37862 RepID=A0A1I7W9S5_HETBA